MYAIIRTGGKQFRVSAGDHIAVERLEAEEGAEGTLGDRGGGGGRPPGGGGPRARGAGGRALP